MLGVASYDLNGDATVDLTSDGTDDQAVGSPRYSFEVCAAAAGVLHQHGEPVEIITITVNGGIAAGLTSSTDSLCHSY